MHHRFLTAFTTLIAIAATSPAARAQADAPAPDRDVVVPWEVPVPPVEHPQVFEAPTARLLPAGVVYAGVGVDSDGTPSASATIGLGDVAEFGVSSTSVVRSQSTSDQLPEAILPYVTATFRMGVREDLVFPYQPAVVLGFRKSFTRDEQGMRSRVAELFLITSKRIGAKTQLHLGVTLWDASLLDLSGPATPVFLHDQGVGSQLRGILAAEVAVKPRAEIMVETTWAPTFDYEQESIEPTARFAFGVRWQALDWLALESGVSIADIGNRNLLPATIFGQVRVINRTLARAYRRSK